MLHATLQNMFVAPRAPTNRKIANTSTFKEEFEENGILYALEDPRVISKYRISDDPVPPPRPSSAPRSAAAAASGRGSVAGASARPSSAAGPNLRPSSAITHAVLQQQSPARSSRDSHVATGVSKANAASTKARAGIMVGPPKNSMLRSSFQRQSLSIDSPSRSQRDEDIADADDALLSGAAPAASRYRRPEAGPKLEVESLSKEEILQLKKKYEDSLKIIDKIIQKPAEATVRDVEKVLHPPGYSDEVRGSTRGKLSAAEAAEVFARRSPSPSLSPSRGRRDARASPNVLRSQSFDSKRKASPARTSVTKGGLSLELQADYDRYLQRKKQLLESEKKGEEEKQRYIEEQQRRFARASKHGSAFKGLEERDKEYLETKKKREERVVQQQEEEKRLEHEKHLQKLRKYEAAAQARRSKGVDMGGARTWKEMEEMEETKRRERVEMRRLELASQGAYPTKMLEASVEEWKTRLHAPPPRPTSPEHHAPDPAKIVAGLEQQHMMWERRLERSKQKLQERKHSTHVDPKVVTMEKRNAEYEAKRLAKAREVERKEEEEKRRKHEAEELRFKRLLTSKNPVWKLTKAAEERAKMVKKSMEVETEKEKQERRLRERKERKSRELSHFLQSVIDQDPTWHHMQEEKKLGASGSAARAEEKRQADAAKAKANQDRIREAVRNRPTLMDRHNQKVAQESARSESLKKLAGAIIKGRPQSAPHARGSTSSSHAGNSARRKSAAHDAHSDDGDDYDLDFFDHDERLEIKA